MRDHLAEHVVANVAHMESAARIREHLEDVGLLRSVVVAPWIRDVEGALRRPRPLPLRLDCLRVVSIHQSSGTKKPLISRGHGESARRRRGAPCATKAD